VQHAELAGQARYDRGVMATSVRITRTIRALERWHINCSVVAHMPILSIILVIVVVGVLLWALNSFVPMDSKIRSILNIVVVLLLIVWLLQAFGLIGPLFNARVG
jgi:hypothetical protein